MKNSNQINRRKFVTTTVAAAGAVAAAATGVGKVNACPIFYDADGNRKEYWCIVEEDNSTPITIYTWENCTTGKKRTGMGKPGQLLGSCTNAANDSSCAEGIEFDKWERVKLSGQEYIIPPDLDRETRALGIRLLGTSPERR